MWFKRFIEWFSNFFQPKEKDTEVLYNLMVVSELPESPKKGIVYVEGNSKTKDYWYALLSCPCGCNDTIMLNLMNDIKPCWKLEKNKNKFSLHPSIWRTKNCKSHFWLKKRRIIWVD